MNGNDSLREQVKALWKRCFTDGDAFTDLYFHLRYSDDINLCLQEDGHVVCALQLLPYALTFHGTMLKADYVSGACTHPDRRRHGLMRELLKQSFQHSYEKGVDLSFLIPAEPWLFDYYARSGYAPVFHITRRLHIAGRHPAPLTHGLHVAHTDQYSPALYRYLTRKQMERPCCILHTEEDLHVVIANLRLFGGAVYTLCGDGNGKAVALAVVFPTETDGLTVGELLADSDALETCLLDAICQERGVNSLSVETPPRPDAPCLRLGMARIVRALPIVQRHAAAHAETTRTFYLVDNEVTANTGLYILERGTCRFRPGQLHQADVPTIGPAELTCRLFAPLQPYMSLMLNE
ncbi:MAG: GNAT family N-acetyltransferase [Prevotellaceae bacterium]|nr:GNAT family N-acetyltransferase [Prevotellaceae bacterium]